jgi:hypothetical protein
MRSPWDNTVNVAATEASFFEVFNKTLYAPPLRGIAQLLRIFLNKNKTTATNNNEIHAYCPAYIMVRPIHTSKKS